MEKNKFKQEILTSLITFMKDNARELTARTIDVWKKGFFFTRDVENSDSVNENLLTFIDARLQYEFKERL